MKNKLKSKNITFLGVTFKPGTDDMRESASIFFVKKILELGGLVSVYDPKAMNNAKENYFKNLNGIRYCKDKMEVLNDIDALILLTEWPEFKNLDWELISKEMRSPAWLFDTRSACNIKDAKKNGINVWRIGAG